MKKAKAAAITMGMAASCLFGCYAVADAATITLDESTASTPASPQPISAYNARKAAAETSVMTRQASKNRTAAEKEKNDKKLNASPAVFEKKVPVSLPDETETTDRIETIEETAPAAAEQAVPETTETPAETTAPVKRIFVKSTPVTVKPYQETTETSTTAAETEAPTEAETSAPETEAPTEAETSAPETEAPTEAETTAPETEAPTETETTAPETEAETSTETTTVQTEASEEETTPAVTETEEETKATTTETVYTVADITTAAHKTTTAQTTTKETTTSVPKPVFSSPAASTTTTPETTTTETTTSSTIESTTTSTTTTSTTSTTTTTTTTTTEPILTTASETTTEAVLSQAEIVDVAEVYLDDFLNVDYQEIETAPAVLETTAPETQTTPETTTTQAAVSAFNSITDREYVLLCNCVAHEAGSDVITIENKAKVVEVVMNRVASSKFPDTIYGVITQKYQFSGSSSYADLTSYSRKVTDNVKAAVDLYFSDPSAFSHGYLYFYGDGSQNHFRTS